MAGGFLLYEALLWEPGEGYFLLDLHVQRLERSASELGFSLDPDGVRKQLREFASRLPPQPRKVRLFLSRDGGLGLEDREVKPSTPVRVAVAEEPVDSRDVFLRHKTSRRDVYERALAAHPEADDVLLWNERRELTETCAANVVLEIEGRRLTPHVSSGLLPGTFRANLLERGEIEEAVLPLDSLDRASALFLINSVRKWCELRLVDS
jgi:para-aminobenzoate synthetase/4-amino-4-deoxychorismate lyase